MLKWGLIGLGKISRKFARDLMIAKGHELAAVASRSQAKAEDFGNEYNVASCYGSYEDLLSDPNIDVVYIGTPHNSHTEWTIKALDAGKHVLCEKPLAVNKHQVEAMIAAAERNNKFLMEALWSRFNPSVSEVIARSKAGALGAVNYIKADFSYTRNDAPDSRMLNLNLAGGSLLDMGIYPVFLAYAIMGLPEEILATAHFHEGGADLQTAIILKYKTGVASLMSGFCSQSDMIATIHGRGGRLVIDNIWHEADSYHEVIDGSTKKYIKPKRGIGMIYEIEEVGHCIANGLVESPTWSHQNSRELIRILDEIRLQIGLKYPFED